MSIEIKIPSIGESITEVTLAAWLKSDGDFVEEGDLLCEIESDKATVELPAENSGTLKIIVEEGTDLAIGAVIATLDTAEGGAKDLPPVIEEKAPDMPTVPTGGGVDIDIKIPSIGESITEVTLAAWLKNDGDFVEEGDLLCEIESDKATVELPAESSGTLQRSAEEGSELGIGAIIGTLKSSGASVSRKEETEIPQAPSNNTSSSVSGHPSPAARKILNEKGMSSDAVNGTGRDGRVTKADAQGVEKSSAAKAPQEEAPVSDSSTSVGERVVKREKMSRLRKTIAKRLTEAKNSTAMLTTFNEVDMHNVMSLRSEYKEAFKEKYDIGLGFMSFFTKACTIALSEVPGVNAMIDGDEVVYHHYADVGVAVSTPKGLVVPVVKNADAMSLDQIEKEIKRLALKGRDGKLTINEMSGGTFTITNGGVFGSMLSTPILNIPQSAILGMHNIIERPVAIKGQVVVHPVMYLALSYDHRIVDGKESVTFLKRVKELIEDPARMLLKI